MSDPQFNAQPNPKPSEAATGKPADGNAEASSAQLTKEEQWALFEKELKESDWGHQPC